MPYPKKRKRPNESALDVNEKRKKTDQHNSETMLRSVVSSASNIAPKVLRQFSQTTNVTSPNKYSFKTQNQKRPDSANRTNEHLIYGRSAHEAGYKAGNRQPRNKSQKSSRGQLSSKAARIPKLPSRSSPLVVHNEEYIYNNFNIPTAAQYGLAKEPVDNHTEILRNANLVSQRESQHESPHRTSYFNKCITKIELDNDIFVVATGHGRTKVEAESNADLHAICVLHDKGLFKDILPGGKYTLASAEVISQEGAAKKDIIDYAARHNCLPQFEIHTGRSRLKKKSLITVLASIPELDLTGFGRAAREQDALLQACISLKQAAEVHHEKTGDGVLLVKDYTKLTSASAKKFLEFYSYQNAERYELDCVKQKSRNAWCGTVTIEGKGQKNTNATSGEGNSDAAIVPLESALISRREFEGIPMSNKKDAEDTALLAAALAMKKEDTNCWKSFVKEMKRGNGEILKAVRPIDIQVDYDAIEVMRRTLREVHKVSDGERLRESSDDLISAQKRRNFSRQLPRDAVAQKSQDLKDCLDQYRNNPALALLREKRSELPMVQHRDAVMSVVEDNEVCVVVGATGSGKTTQLPQLILEGMIDAGNGGQCNIICTQPRRIAAISVSQRVAVERNESLQESIGYSVRFDSRLPKFGGSVNYCTTGILLRQLQDSQEATLDGISHIIIDEVHERDIQIDFLLVVLRQIMADRKANGLKPFKVILMSATIDTNLFCKYFGAGYETGRCPYIEVPGRTFPVTQHFLDELHPILRSQYTRKEASELYSRDTETYIKRELINPPEFVQSAPVTENNSVAGSADDDDKAKINWKSQGMVGEDGELDLAMDKEDTITPVGLMSVTIAHILKTTREGSILVFLPGLQEITALNRTLTTTKPLGVDFNATDDYKIYLLHSAIPQMQQEVFEKLGPGRRKIILSTNIAETSITIPDVVYVVDSSKHRESQYDQAKRISSLVSTWTSKSNAKQRAGRAGRVQNGHYYSMASEARYESFETAPQPEILRTDLQELCLQIKSMGVEDIGKFLRNAIEPPPVNSVESSIDHLQALRALDESENLTPLGRLLSTLPVQPSLGKMVILAVIFRCLDPVLILAAASASKDPFLSPLDRRAEADARKARYSQGSGSDHAAIVNAFSEWREARRQSHDQGRSYAFENFLHYNTLVSIAQTAEQVLEIMQKSGLVGGSGTRPSRGSRHIMSLYGSEEENSNSSSLPLQVALATAGFYPNLAVQTSAPRLLRTAHENAAQIHLNSLAAPRSSGGRYGPISRQDAQPVGTLFTFSQKTQADANNVNLRGVTKTSPLSVVLFGGQSQSEGAILRIDEWIPFFARGPQMYVTKDFGKCLDGYLESTFARLGAANQRRLLAQSEAADGFLQQDRVREPLIRGVVQALELCAPKNRASVAQSFSHGASRGGSRNAHGSGYGRGAGTSGYAGTRGAYDSRQKALSQAFFSK
ncbi:protein of unknown function [Taphrina deformans PYCC 5710]|uniref:RNA helicase n=1 Tax=Taphrina deformans (strain PYCC 5710 / ATCC 11124 / CBS 356.35 / IMI 108563 / JCM 9778 / NBRC 8474) TaxID=1097556 RepID=R4XEQ9_TAPDE|nr:protein of unknown function [Taphrina deformans PYCC 5710]|eukprot:CCG84337.1 protein of unknown function [Taphrina deformans PYCC 5710]